MRAADRSRQTDECSLSSSVVSWVDLTPLCEWLCNELKLEVDESLVEKMRAANETKMVELDEKIKDAEENLGETEVRDALVAKAEYLCNIGDKVVDVV